jgi:hypothetical protein
LVLSKKQKNSDILEVTEPNKEIYLNVVTTISFYNNVTTDSMNPGAWLYFKKGFNTYKITEKSEFNKLLCEFDVIFNSVPERIISNETLLSIPSDTVLLELASAPGGFDPDIAGQCDVHFINGKGIPGKYAPKSAGKIVGDTVLQYLKREGIL